MAKVSNSKEPSFEEAFRRLEETVQALEGGNLSLAQATSLYEEGMRLAKVCSQRLDTAELKISELQAAFASATGQDEDAAMDEDDDA
ncbi:MAG: exodeoxyribonuclease VII small subunit [Chloroflexi bacterium]|nr:exodeoxyribonuclease VII small subunit [Chloroflexota bacterium]